MNENSRIFKAVDEYSLTRIIQHVFDRDTVVAEAKLREGGLFNTTYLVTTKCPDQNVIIRFAPSRQELLFQFEREMMAKEPWIYEQLRRVGIPVPRILAFDDSYRIIPRSYVVLEYVAGIPLHEAKMSDMDRSTIQERLGKATAAMHSITADYYGWPQPDHPERAYRTWWDFIAAFTDEIAEKTTRFEVFDEMVMQTYYDFFREHKHVFELAEAPRFVHNDLWEPNVLVREENGTWDIAAVIDADRALFGDREYEFALWGNNPHFMRGYGRTLDDSHEANIRRTSYMFLLQLMNAYFHKVQNNNEAQYLHEKALAEATFEQLRHMTKLAHV